MNTVVLYMCFFYLGYLPLVKAVLLGSFDVPGLLEPSSFVFLTEALFLPNGH